MSQNLEYASQGVLAWGLRVQFCHPQKLFGSWLGELQLWREVGVGMLKWKMIIIEAQVYLVLILC